MSKALTAIVCGMPFSGTTFLSRLICSHPAIDAGFECGLLFGNKPLNFPESGRFYNWMMDTRPPYNWKLTQKQLDEVCAAESFEAAYGKIVEHCHLFDGSVKFVLDKTPAYVYSLKKIMRRVTDVPVVIIEKDKMHQYYSFKKREQTREFFEERYKSSQRSISEVEGIPGLRRRILRLKFNEVVTKPAPTYRRIINFIHRFNPEVQFEKEQVKILQQSLRQDMKGAKKLRSEYSIEDEKVKMEKALTPDEMEFVNSIM